MIILEALYEGFDLLSMLGGLWIIPLGYLIVRLTDNTHTKKLKEEKLRKILAKHGIRE